MTSPAAPPAAAQGARVLQVWPEWSVGVASGQLDAATGVTSTQRLPMGVCRAASGEAVQARTYLRFPLDVFPPGTDVSRAILYVYVDSGSASGEAMVGVYRVTESLEVEWGRDPAAWPGLLSTPIAVTTVRFAALERPPVPPPPVPTATPTITSTAAPTSTPPVTATPTLVPYWQMTLTPPPSPTPALTPMPPAPLFPTMVTLAQGEGVWLTWDVTALLRAWLSGETPNRGLALAPAPSPDAAPETAGDLLVARWLAVDEANTRPYIIAEFDVLPVTPTAPASPLATPRPGARPILPQAGASGEGTLCGAAGIGLIGTALLAAGLRRRSRG